MAETPPNASFEPASNNHVFDFVTTQMERDGTATFSTEPVYLEEIEIIDDIDLYGNNINHNNTCELTNRVDNSTHSGRSTASTYSNGGGDYISNNNSMNTNNPAPNRVTNRRERISSVINVESEIVQQIRKRQNSTSFRRNRKRNKHKHKHKMGSKGSSNVSSNVSETELENNNDNIFKKEKNDQHIDFSHMTDEEFEQYFEQYWEARYGLTIRTSLYMIQVLGILVICVDYSLMNSLNESIFTISCIFIHGLVMLIVNYRKENFESIASVSMFVLLFYSIVQYTVFYTLSNYKFIGYYACTVIFCYNYMHLRLKFTRGVLFTCFALWNVLMLINLCGLDWRSVLGNSEHGDNNRDHLTVGTWLAQAMMLVLIKVEFETLKHDQSTLLQVTGYTQGSLLFFLFFGSGFFVLVEISRLFVQTSTKQQNNKTAKGFMHSTESQA